MKKPTAPRPHRASRAFTLIELLTVVAIIGILAAIVLASIGAVRNSARRADSANNIRQLAMAVLMFADEHRGTIPGRLGPDGRSWPLDLIPYLGESENAFFSPADHHDTMSDPAVTATKIADMPGWQAQKIPSYAWNFQVGGSNRVTNPMRLNDYFALSRALVLVTCSEGSYSQRFGFVDTGSYRPSAERYGGRVLGAFLDGHVEVLRSTDFATQDPYMRWQLVAARNPNP